MMPTDSPSSSLPGTPALQAARRYAALQPFIVDKHPFFAEIVRRVEAAQSGTPGRIVELGVGTGGFLEAITRREIWPTAELIGADQSPARIAVANDALTARGRSALLCAGVNALDSHDPFFSRIAPAGSADVVVLSQFEHYAPNNEHSPLARRLTQAGQAWCSKAALRRLAASRLRPGGWLFVIDDYAADTPAEQESWDLAWDTHVVREFATEEVRRALEPIEPAWAAALVHRYHSDRPWQQRLALAARARARRRHRDGEEVQSLSAAQDDFRGLFVGGHCGMVPHPCATAHPQFYLLWGRHFPEP